MAGRKSDFTLPTNTLDELFSSQEERDEAKLSKIRDIPLEEIDDFPDHPFQVREDEDISSGSTACPQENTKSKRSAVCMACIYTTAIGSATFRSTIRNNRIRRGFTIFSKTI